MNTIPNVKMPFPGPNARRILDLDDRYMMTTTKTLPLVIKRAKGMVIEDVDGNTFYDFCSGASVANVGHCHPRVVEAIREQSENLIHFPGTDFYYESQSLLMEKLAHITPGDFAKRVFLCNSGAEAVEAAMKLARYATGRKQFIAFMGSFHGRTMGAQSLSSRSTLGQKEFFPMVPGVTFVPFANCDDCFFGLSYPECDTHCADVIETHYFRHVLDPADVAALFLEPIQGENGFIVPPKEFVQKIRDITKRHGIILVADEVQTGMGRTGKMFAVEHFDISPDILLVSKGLASGLPLGAVIFNDEFDYKYPGFHASTLGGNAVACAAAIATLSIFEKPTLLNNVVMLSGMFLRELNSLKETSLLFKSFSGLGFMLSLRVDFDRLSGLSNGPDILSNILERGAVLMPLGVDNLRITPPLIAQDNHAYFMIKMLKEISSTVDVRMKNGG